MVAPKLKVKAKQKRKQSQKQAKVNILVVIKPKVRAVMLALQWQQLLEKATKVIDNGFIASQS